ncbi:MAG: transporter [Eubacteriales bacterium]
MKTFLLHIFVLFLFFLLLIFPMETLNGATAGLLLWYQVLLPTLLPFIIVSTLLIKTKAYQTIYKFTGSTIGKFFHTTQGGTLAVIIGFLCGYPMGAKVINDLRMQDTISEQEAKYLLSFCNNTSPMFIISYFIYQILEDTSLLFPTFLALYSAPILVSFFTRRIYKIDSKSYLAYEPQNLPPKSNSRFSYKVLDDIIMDSISLILKIGGYVMLFSIFICLSTTLTSRYMPSLRYLIPLLEITNGLNIYRSLNPELLQYSSMLFLVSFGGLCAVGQTQCVLDSQELKISHYFFQKIITAIIAVIIGVLLFTIIHKNHLLH